MDDNIDINNIIKSSYHTFNFKINNNNSIVLLINGDTFLGSHILMDLIKHKFYKEIIVFIAADTIIEAHNKMFNTFKLYHNMSENTIIDLCYNKVFIINGDLTKHKLGISTNYYDIIIQNINIIIHSYAEDNIQFNTNKNYQEWETDNIYSITQIINLAIKAKNFVKFNYISSISIFDNDYHNDIINIPNSQELHNTSINTFKDNYSKTVFIADTLVKLARNNGIICNIFRIGTLICDTKYYNWNTRDLYFKMLIHCIQTKTIPYTPYNKRILINMLPVDLASYVIIKANEQENNIDINLVGPQIDLCLFLGTISNFITVTPIPYNIWIDQITKNAEIYTIKQFLPNVDTHTNKIFDTQIINKYILNNMIDIEKIIKSFIQLNSYV